MRYARTQVLIASILLSGLGCMAQAGKAVTTDPTLQVHSVIEVPPIWNSVADVEEACADSLAEAERLRRAIAAGSGERTGDNTLEPFNRMLTAIDRALPLSELIANVHPDKAVRDQAETCQQQVMELVTAIQLDRGLYDAVAAVDVSELDPIAVRFVRHVLRDYRRAGVDRDETTRERIGELKAGLVKVGQDFMRNVREDRRSVRVDPEALAGMPPDWRQAHPAGEDGLVEITTAYPDFFPVQTYATRGELREKLYRQYLTRAHPANHALLIELLSLRHELSTLLGHPNWASYNAEDKMAKDTDTIAAFIDKVAGLARPRMERDLEDLLTRKQQDDPGAEEVEVWDRFYYVKKIQTERYGVDSEEVRGYFNYPRVKAGLMEVMERLFGVTMVRRPDEPVWHEQVEAYDLREGGKTVARFYLDMHPREGKYGHAAEFPMLTGIPGVQLPSAALVCNFPDPTHADGLALMEHNQVTTFFHEFGHLMHQLLGGGHPWVSLSGITCEWDFVEAPSQLFEEWAWNPHVLAGFARHHETGRTIPVELVEKMRAADEFGKGVHVMRQMFYAALSYTYHSSDPSHIDPLATLKDVQARYNPYPYTDGTHTYTSFSHLVGYSSMYYTYMWSLVLAKDLWTRFEQKGPFDTTTSMRFRRSVLEPGGTVDASDMVEQFLGRPSSFEAYQAWLERDE